MNKKRYQEEYEEGSNLLWPSEEEDKITRKFYRDLSHLSKKEIKAPRAAGGLRKRMKLKHRCADSLRVLLVSS